MTNAPPTAQGDARPQRDDSPLSIWRSSTAGHATAALPCPTPRRLLAILTLAPLCYARHSRSLFECATSALDPGCDVKATWEGGGTAGNRLNRLLRVLRMFKLARMLKLARYMKNIELLQHNPGLVRISKLALYMLLFCHLLGVSCPIASRALCATRPWQSLACVLNGHRPRPMADARSVWLSWGARLAWRSVYGGWWEISSAQIPLFLGGIRPWRTFGCRRPTCLHRMRRCSSSGLTHSIGAPAW